MASGISDISQILSQKYLLSSMRNKLNENQRQINTGKLSTSVAGLGTMGASNAIDFRNQSNVLDVYKSNIATAKTTMTVMDKALGSITNDVRKVLSTLRSQLQSTEPKAVIISDEARGILDNIVSKINEQVAGKYIFAGDDIYNAPFANLATLNTNASAAVATWLTGTTPAGVVSDARSVSGTGVGLSASLATSGSVSFRAADNLNIDYTVQAYGAGFQDVLRGLATIANLPQPTTALEQQNYWNIVNGAITLLDEGAVALDTTQGILGNKAKLADQLVLQHGETQATFDEFVGVVEDVDMAEASTLFQTLQNQMQMSYNVIAQLKDLSLINYL